jgi:hypothetical protein
MPFFVFIPILRKNHEFFRNTKEYQRIEMKIITLSVIIYTIGKFKSNLYVIIYVIKRGVINERKK